MVGEKAQIYVGRQNYLYGKAENYQVFIDGKLILTDVSNNLFDEGSFNQKLVDFTAKLLYQHGITISEEYKINNGLKRIADSDIYLKREMLEPNEILDLEKILKIKLEELSQNGKNRKTKTTTNKMQ